MALVAALLVLSGCVAPEDEVDTNVEPEPPVLRTQTRSMGATIEGPQVLLEREVVAGPWELEAPETIQSFSVEAEWESTGNILEPTRNDLELRVTAPDDGSVTVPAEEGVAYHAPEAPSPGVYVVEIVGSGLIVEDKVTIGLSWAWLEFPSEDLATGPVQLEQVGERWRATITYQTMDEVSGPLDVDVYTYNGLLDVQSVPGSEAKSTVGAFAMATSKERASELVRGISVSLGIEDGGLKSHASNRNTDQRDGESSGADVSLEVPVAVSGTLRTSNGNVKVVGMTLDDVKVRTSNGGVSLEDVRTSGLEVRTSNGQVSGGIITSGDVEVRTSNGPVDLELIPEDSLVFDVRTSNGKVDLRLKEGGLIGHRLDAETSNGKITADMDEATLSGDEDTEKRLETDGYDDRDLQVSGEVRTSNADVRFKGS